MPLANNRLGLAQLSRQSPVSEARQLSVKDFNV
jgi:hypothetical protein